MFCVPIGEVWEVIYIFHIYTKLTATIANAIFVFFSI